MRVCQQWKAVKNYKCNVSNTGGANTVLCGLFLLTEKSVLYALKWSKRVLQCSRHLHRNKPEIRLMHLTEKRSKYRETRFYMGLLEDRVDG